MIAFLLAAVLTVVSVADGDTLSVSNGEQRITLRLAEIDAPERTMPFSQVARRNLVRLCMAATDMLFEPVAIDRYGRTVAHLWCDGRHVNWQQVADGLA